MVEVINTGKVNVRTSPLGSVPTVAIRRRGEEIRIDRDELISRKEVNTPPGTAKVVISSNNDLTGFTFYVNLTLVGGMTLDQQSGYILLKARRELVRAFYAIGVENLARLNSKLQELHLHELLSGEKTNYACDHKHEAEPVKQEEVNPTEVIVSALTGFPMENPTESLNRLRFTIGAMSQRDRGIALVTFLRGESEEVRKRAMDAELTEDGRDEYLKKFALVQYLRYIRSKMPELKVKTDAVLDPLWALEWMYRNVRLDLLRT